MPNEKIDEDGYCISILDPEQAFDDWGLRAIFFTTSMNTTIPTLISFIGMYNYIIENNLSMPPQSWPWEVFNIEK